MSVNGEPAQEARLANGDVISLGAARLRFGFTPNRQRALRAREWLTWAGLILLMAAQAAIIYWLLG